MGDRTSGFDDQTLQTVARQVAEVKARGTQVAIVVGGGNIFRGVQAAQRGMERATADHAGMLATIINALVLQDALEKEGIETRTMSALEVRAVAEPYIRRRAIRHLEKGRVVIFAAGTGNPFMTTDTAAALRAIEVGAEVILMAKNGVDGVYDSDPKKNPGARRFERLTHQEALTLHLEVMDVTAFSLCLENRLPVVVFDLQAPGSILRAVTGEPIGTLVSS